FELHGPGESSPQCIHVAVDRLGLHALPLTAGPPGLDPGRRDAVELVVAGLNQNAGVDPGKGGRAAAAVLLHPGSVDVLEVAPQRRDAAHRVALAREVPAARGLAAKPARLRAHHAERQWVCRIDDPPRVARLAERPLAPRAAHLHI